MNCRKACPKDRVEYNSGKVPVSQDPDKTPSNNLSVAETIRSIEENGSWMALKNIETDPAYNDLFETCLGELKQVIGSKPVICTARKPLFSSRPPDQ